jgi:recombination protein RecA
MNEIKELQEFVNRVNKRYDENSLYFLGKAPISKVECIPTGSLSLDLAIGGNESLMGIPRGRITEIWGPKGTGKTTLCNHIIANAQKMGIVTAFLDYEHAYPPEYASAIGVDLDKLLFGQFTELERGWDVIESMARTLPGCLIVVDSIAQMAPRAEIEGDFGDSHPGLHSRLLAHAMRRNMGVVKQNNVALVCANQIRHIFGAKKYEEKQNQPGGEAVKHGLSLQIDLALSSVEKEKNAIVARNIRTNIRFSKIARPYCKAEYTIRFGKGIEQGKDVREAGVKVGVIDLRGHHYYFEEEKFADSKAKAETELSNNPELREKIRQHIFNIFEQENEDA